MGECDPSSLVERTKDGSGALLGIGNQAVRSQLRQQAGHGTSGPCV